MTENTTGKLLFFLTFSMILVGVVIAANHKVAAYRLERSQIMAAQEEAKSAKALSLEAFEASQVAVRNTNGQATTLASMFGVMNDFAYKLDSFTTTSVGTCVAVMPGNQSFRMDCRWKE